MYDQKYISTDKTFWGTDSMPPVVYTGHTTYELVRAANGKAVTDETINVYKNALTETLENVKTYADNEIKDMAKITKLMK